MILKASAEKGSSSDGLRSRTSSLPGLVPWVGGRSTGDGRKSTTASSIGWTPLFLKALPFRIGTQWFSRVPTRSARRMSAALISSSPSTFSIKMSSKRVSTSSSLWWYSSARSLNSSGMSMISSTSPWSSWWIVAFIEHRSMIPL